MIDSRGGSEPRAAERSLPSMPVRVTRAELERWKAAAAARGLTLSAWVRAALDLHAALNSIESSAQSEGFSPISDLVAEMAEAGAALRAGLEAQRKPLLPPAEPDRVLDKTARLPDAPPAVAGCGCDACSWARTFAAQRDTLPAPGSCHACGGTGGGPEPHLACTACEGSGLDAP